MSAITGLPNFVGDTTLSLAKLNQAWTALVMQLGGTVQPFAWAANTAYVVGDRITTAAGSVNYVCIRAGTSGGSAPTWGAQTSGGLVTDNTVTWMEDGGGEAVFPGNLNGSNLVTYPGWTRGQVVEGYSITSIMFYAQDPTVDANKVVALATPFGFTAFASTTVTQEGDPITGGLIRMRSNGVTAGHFRLPGYVVPSSRARRVIRGDLAGTQGPSPIYLAKLETIPGYAEHHENDTDIQGDDVVEMDFSEIETAGNPTHLHMHVWGLVRHCA